MVSTSLSRITGQQLFSSKQEILACNMTRPGFQGFLCNDCLLLLLPKYAAKCANQIVLSGIFCRFGFHKPKQNHTECSIKLKKITIFSVATFTQPWQTHTCLVSCYLAVLPPSFRNPNTNGLPGFGTHPLTFNLIVAEQQQLRQGVCCNFVSPCSRVTHF